MVTAEQLIETVRVEVEKKCSDYLGTEISEALMEHKYERCYVLEECDNKTDNKHEVLMWLAKKALKEELDGLDESSSGVQEMLKIGTEFIGKTLTTAGFDIQIYTEEYLEEKENAPAKIISCIVW